MRKLANEELNRISADEFKQAEKTPLIIILDNVRSLNNIGSVFRTADAFRVEAVYLCGITATPPHREIQKTALGATETVDWKYFATTTEAVRSLKDICSLYAIEQTESSIYLDAFAPPRGKKMAVIFGNEVKGVEQEVINSCDGVIEIPQLGTKHSLNIAVSAGIVVWDLYLKLKEK
jgi:tRNA G18 (ribose-2'-O)-methylase SpoU